MWFLRKLWKLLPRRKKEYFGEANKCCGYYGWSVIGGHIYFEPTDQPNKIRILHVVQARCPSCGEYSTLKGDSVFTDGERALEAEQAFAVFDAEQMLREMGKNETD